MSCKKKENKCKKCKKTRGSYIFQLNREILYEQELIKKFERDLGSRMNAILTVVSELRTMLYQILSPVIIHVQMCMCMCCIKCKISCDCVQGLSCISLYSQVIGWVIRETDLKILYLHVLPSAVSLIMQSSTFFNHSTSHIHVCMTVF